MAENVWLLNDSAPTPFGQEFATAAAKAWGWFGLPIPGEGSEFDAPASPWAFDFSVAEDYYMWTAAAAAAQTPYQPWLHRAPVLAQ